MKYKQKALSFSAAIAFLILLSACDYAFFQPAEPTPNFQPTLDALAEQKLAEERREADKAAEEEQRQELTADERLDAAFALADQKLAEEKREADLLQRIEELESEIKRLQLATLESPRRDTNPVSCGPRTVSGFYIPSDNPVCQRQIDAWQRADEQAALDQRLQDLENQILEKLNP